MGLVIRFPRRHARASLKGRGTSVGQSPSGQLSENQHSADSSRPTVMSAPSSKAVSFFPSLNARELTVDNGTSKILPYARATRSSCSMPDIGAISVNLPVMSTVNLPDAQPKGSGHSTGMDLKVLLNNIDRLKKTSDHAVSVKSGSEDAIRNLRRYASGEIKGMWTLDTLEKVARALNTTPWELLRPPGAIAADDDLNERVNQIIDQRLSEAQPVRKKKIR